MSTPQAVIEFEDIELPKQPFLVRIWDLSRRQPLGAFGLLIVIAMIIMAVFANVLSPYDPEANAFEHML